MVEEGSDCLDWIYGVYKCVEGNYLYIEWRDGGQVFYAMPRFFLTVDWRYPHSLYFSLDRWDNSIAYLHNGGTGAGSGYVYITEDENIYIGDFNGPVVVFAHILDEWAATYNLFAEANIYVT